MSELEHPTFPHLTKRIITTVHLQPNFHFGIPCADWLRCVMNRIDPKLFMDCFSSWVAECWPDRLDLVAIDGKTSRRTHNRRPQGAASGVGLRDQQPVGAWSGGRI